MTMLRRAFLKAILALFTDFALPHTGLRYLPFLCENGDRLLVEGHRLFLPIVRR